MMIQISGLPHVHGFEKQGCSKVHATQDDLQMFCNLDGSLRAAYSRVQITMCIQLQL